MHQRDVTRRCGPFFFCFWSLLYRCTWEVHLRCNFDQHNHTTLKNCFIKQQNNQLLSSKQKIALISVFLTEQLITCYSQIALSDNAITVNKTRLVNETLVKLSGICINTSFLYTRSNHSKLKLKS